MQGSHGKSTGRIRSGKVLQGSPIFRQQMNSPSVSLVSPPPASQPHSPSASPSMSPPPPASPLRVLLLHAQHDDRDGHRRVPAQQVHQDLPAVGVQLVNRLEVHGAQHAVLDAEGGSLRVGKGLDLVVQLAEGLEGNRQLYQELVGHRRRNYAH